MLKQTPSLFNRIGDVIQAQGIRAAVGYLHVLHLDSLKRANLFECRRNPSSVETIGGSSSVQATIGRIKLLFGSFKEEVGRHRTPEQSAECGNSAASLDRIPPLGQRPEELLHSSRINTEGVQLHR